MKINRPIIIQILVLYSSLIFTHASLAEEKNQGAAGTDYLSREEYNEIMNRDKEDQPKRPKYQLRSAEALDFSSLPQRLSGYRPIYFLYSDDDPSKIQLSFKYNLWSDSPFYLGYTQIMFWELKKSSQPFRAIDYKPEIFYRLSLEDAWFDEVDIGLWEHRSNGASGPDSRTWDRSYIRFKSYIPFGWTYFSVSNMFFVNHHLSAKNPDLRDYSGFWEGEIALVNFFGGVFDKEQIYYRIFAGDKQSSKLNRGGQEIGIQFKLTSPKFAPYFYIQYYRGYLENLLEYNQKNNAFRFGLLFD